MQTYRAIKQIFDNLSTDANWRACHRTRSTL